MKLLTKIFLCAITVITAALTVLGYVMISGSFKNALERETENCMDRYQILKFTLQSSMISMSKAGRLDDNTLSAAAENTLAAISGLDRAAVLDQSGGILSTNYPDNELMLPPLPEPDDITSMTEKLGSEYRHTVSGTFSESGQTVTLVYSRRITSVFEEKHQMERRFLTAYILIEVLAAIVMAGLAFVIARPINKLTKATKSFAEGKLGERTSVRDSGEIGELSESFNVMADTIEKNITSLELSAKQKDDFTASFAHELKTPLTSVIGYADMIYQKDTLSRAEIHEAAGYIMNEGMRLEALSLKLMELIVLEKQEFTLVEMEAGEVFGDIADTVKPLLDKRGASLTVGADRAYIAIEFDLFKTLVMNIIDNSAKADGKNITLTGVSDGDFYNVSIKDDGRGIPQDQLERITEAFYMVDKSRSRREHGAGLGLAIAVRIARVHGTELKFESAEGEGTTVSFVLRKAGNAE